MELDDREKVELFNSLRRIASAPEVIARGQDPNYRGDFSYAKENRPADPERKKSEG